MTFERINTERQRARSSCHVRTYVVRSGIFVREENRKTDIPHVFLQLFMALKKLCDRWRSMTECIAFAIVCHQSKNSPVHLYIWYFYVVAVATIVHLYSESTSFSLSIFKTIARDTTCFAWQYSIIGSIFLPISSHKTGWSDVDPYMRLSTQ